ncbi:MAG: orc1/cdc6 family replication initiation protein [Candidatus Bathyarchaeota archaeon]|nr:orc1/cdc6 family replication initiation protein [Candidatus Bathyarchaeota archaeon]
MKNRQADVLDEVFQRFLQGSHIFQNRSLLRHDYVPDKLPHRESEIRSLGEIVAPSLEGAPFSSLLIYGKTGTGKTAVMRYVLSVLSRKGEVLGSPMKACFVNCRLTGTEYRILASLCSTIGVKVPFTGLALGEVFDRFKGSLDSHKLLLIVVLDEIDEFVRKRGDFLLYELTRINEALSDSKVSIIGISNDLRFKEMLDPRVLSTLSEEEVVFKPYNADELRDILVDRAELAFYDGVLSDGAVRLCAALAAAEHGDARRALDLLRVAAELAEREGADSVSDEHVRNAERRIEHDRIAEAVTNLPAHSKIVVLSVYMLSRLNSGHSVTGHIYNVYSELCEELGMVPLTQRRVSGLINELDVIGLLNTQVVSLGRYGRTKKIHLAIPRALIGNVLCEDDRFGSVLKDAPRFLPGLIEGKA